MEFLYDGEDPNLQNTFPQWLLEQGEFAPSEEEIQANV